jgi:hypothetical protein
MVGRHDLAAGFGLHCCCVGVRLCAGGRRAALVSSLHQLLLQLLDHGVEVANLPFLLEGSIALLELELGHPELGALCSAVRRKLLLPALMRSSNRGITLLREDFDLGERHCRGRCRRHEEDGRGEEEDGEGDTGGVAAVVVVEKSKGNREEEINLLEAASVTQSCLSYASCFCYEKAYCAK